MSNLNLRLPDHIHNHVRDLAKREGISINQLITLAVAEKISVLDAENYLKKRAKRANTKDFREVMAKVADIEADEQDQIPDDLASYFEAGNS